MASATSIKEAIKQWEVAELERRRKEWEKKASDAAAAGAPGDAGEFDDTPIKAPEEEMVRLLGMCPPIYKMDKDLMGLKMVKHLSLSTNCIDKIGPGLKELEHLEVLSLARNNIKKLENLDLPMLKELWISYNRIEKLSGLDKMKKLTTLYITNNNISNWSEVDRHIHNLAELTDLAFCGNPLEKGMQDKHAYRIGMLAKVPQLSKLDGKGYEPEERSEAEALKDD